jgi:hypothetical protein
LEKTWKKLKMREKESTLVRIFSIIWQTPDDSKMMRDRLQVWRKLRCKLRAWMSKNLTPVFEIRIGKWIKKEEEKRKVNLERTRG